MVSNKNQAVLMVWVRLKHGKWQGNMAMKDGKRQGTMASNSKTCGVK